MLTWSTSEHGEMRLDLLCTEGLQQRGTLVGPQSYPLPLGLGFSIRAVPGSPRCLGHAPSVGLHQLLQAGMHLLWRHAIHHVRVHAILQSHTRWTSQLGVRRTPKLGTWSAGAVMQLADADEYALLQCLKCIFICWLLQQFSQEDYWLLSETFCTHG